MAKGCVVPLVNFLTLVLKGSTGWEQRKTNLQGAGGLGEDYSSSLLNAVLGSYNML